MRLFLFLALCGAMDTVHCQNYRELGSIQPDSLNFSNILVKKLDSDSLVSNFLIWVKDEVKSHKHVHHSETVLVLEGEGIMNLGGSEFLIRKGDYIFIPADTPHAVKVTSKKSLKVLSIQAPEFKGDDRVFID
jgi:mannose-6-phosphate isomerase-like protein (cupin superfamily)